MNHLLLACLFDPDRRACCLARRAIPPAPSHKPRDTRQQEYDANSNRDRPGRHIEPRKQFTGNVIGCCHGQRHKRQLSRKHTPAKIIDNFFLEYHGGENPKNTSSTMRDSKHDERENEVRCATEGDVKSSADEKRNADGGLHAFSAFAGNPPCDKRANSSSDSTRRE